MHFEVYEELSYRSDILGSVSTPKYFPCCELVFNPGWDDYGYNTWFSLWYLPNEVKSNWQLLGELKIACTTDKNCFNAIPKEFDDTLPDSFFSLGITPHYYERLHRVLKNQPLAHKILQQLRDCATNIEVRESIEDLEVYQSSLRRELISERAENEGLMLLNGALFRDQYSFDLTFSINYRPECSSVWSVKFDDFQYPVKRLYGIIGENGVGKTSLLKKLFEALKSNTRDEHLSQLPVFSSILVINSSQSDEYDEDGDKRIPAHVLTLSQNRKDTEKLITSLHAIQNRKKSLDRKSLAQVLRECLMDFVGPLAEDFFMGKVEVFDNIKHDKLIIDIEKIKETTEHLSSGQLQILELAAFLIAHLHSGSLIIIDEPEVHLHPSSIVKFMAFLSWILDRFGSFAIIATHSPLIIREMVNDNVYHFQKLEENIPNISKAAYSTFGENIAELYRNVFGYDESQSLFSYEVQRIIKSRNKRLKEDVSTSDDNFCQDTFNAIRRLFFKNLPLNLNARLRIMDMIRIIEEETHHDA